MGGKVHSTTTLWIYGTPTPCAPQPSNMMSTLNFVKILLLYRVIISLIATRSLNALKNAVEIKRN